MPLLPIFHYQQPEQAECLAACAAMVLDYLQMPVSYRDLVKRLHIGPAGAPFRNLERLTGSGVSVSIQQGTIQSLQN